MKTTSKVRILCEAGLMIALATILSYIKVFNLPQGGSITLEMLPLVIMAMRHGTKWGCATGFTSGLLQMIMGFENVLYCNTLLSQFGCIMLDYLLASAVLGLAPLFAGKKTTAGLVTGTVIAGILRFVCNFLSGWLLWGSYAWEGWSAWAYSLAYNGSYMVPNIIIAAIIMGLLSKPMGKFLRGDDLK